MVLGAGSTDDYFFLFKIIVRMSSLRAITVYAFNFSFAINLITHAVDLLEVFQIEREVVNHVVFYGFIPAIK